MTDYTEDDVALVAAATEQHYIVADRSDAMGNSPCICDQWWDAAGDNPGWDQHMAEVTLAALANAGRLLPEDTRTDMARVNEAADIMRDYLAAEAPEAARLLFNADVEEMVMRVWPVIAGRVGPWVPVPSEPPAETRPAQVWACGAAHAVRSCTSRNPHRGRSCGWRPAEHREEQL